MARGAPTFGNGGSTTARPLWLGADQRSAFAWFHTPDGSMARAGVVICPPLGFDYLLSHYALRKLAEALVARGFCVVRLDYDGTSDSAGDNKDPDRVDAWLQSIRFAVDALTKAGVEETCLVGMRFGATLAAEVAGRDGGVDQIVLWDPYVSGGSFLIEQHAVSVLSFGVPVDSPDGSVETPGFVYDAATAAATRDVNIVKHLEPLARRGLVLTRSDRPANPLILRRRIAHEAVAYDEAVGQAELMDGLLPEQRLPFEAIERISRWLAEGASERSTACRSLISDHVLSRFCGDARVSAGDRVSGGLA